MSQLARITRKHPFFKLKPKWRTKIWHVKAINAGRAILVDNTGGNLFADVGCWRRVRS